MRVSGGMLRGIDVKPVWHKQKRYVLYRSPKINCQALKHNKIVNECSGEENMNGHKAKGRWEFLIVGKTNDVRIYHKCVESLGGNCFCS